MEPLMGYEEWVLRETRLDSGETYLTDDGEECKATRGDFILDWMKRKGMPVTKENYVRNAFWDANHELGAEEEAELPGELT